MFPPDYFSNMHNAKPTLSLCLPAGNPWVRSMKPQKSAANNMVRLT